MHADSDTVCASPQGEPQVAHKAVAELAKEMDLRSRSSSFEKVDPITHVLIIYVGGTIGMKKSERGFAPVQGWLHEKLASLPQFHDKTQPDLTTPLSRFGKRVHYKIKEYSPLLDSSNANPSDWIKLATDIYRQYDKYDAFIVLHGTDTMAYTASALSFMLENLSKTIILTGSQISLAVEPNDGVDNLLGALTIAGHYEIPEVCLYFAGKLLRGNRSLKVKATDLDAFQSPNFQPLIELAVNIKVNWNSILTPPTDRRLLLHTGFDQNVGVLKLFPGITARTIENFLLPPMKGCILETYGAGNAPDNREDFLNALRNATNRGVVIVNVTQCLTGMVECNYATGRALVEAGVISGFDMTTEGALAKLSFLLGKGLKPTEVKAEMAKSLAGELSIPDNSRFSYKDKTFVKSIAAALRAYRGIDEGEIREVEKALYPVLMCTAAKNGEVAEIESMLANGADKNSIDYDKRTALHVACCEGKIQVVKFLVEKGAYVNPVDRWGRTPMADAASSGHDEIVEYLKERGGLMEFDKKAAILRAAVMGNLDDFKRLYADSFIDQVFDDKDRTLLHIAATEGHVMITEFLLANGANTSVVDKIGDSPLHNALDHGHFEVASLLSRASKNRKNLELSI
jgi:lysophospholipase